MNPAKVLMSVAIAVWATLPVAAQPAPPYAPPDRELWDLMGKAISDIPMSLAAHQQVQALLTNVQREAQMREARAKGPPKPPESEPQK